VNNTLTLLGLLSRQPSYGYDLKHSCDCYFGTEKQLAFGQVYSTPARMIRDELISALGDEAGGGPDRKKYEIAVAGQDKFGSGCSPLTFPQNCSPKVGLEIQF
jgi:DNA-binding PadR family transcriptional regulator